MLGTLFELVLSLIPGVGFLFGLQKLKDAGKPVPGYPADGVVPLQIPKLAWLIAILALGIIVFRFIKRKLKLKF
jgi:hypothetical protein